MDIHCHRRRRLVTSSLHQDLCLELGRLCNILALLITQDRQLTQGIMMGAVVHTQEEARVLVMVKHRVKAKEAPGQNSSPQKVSRPSKAQIRVLRVTLERV